MGSALNPGPGWGYYCSWLSLKIGWLLFIPLGGLQPNLWPKLSQGTRKHTLKIVAFLFRFNRDRNPITMERWQFSNLPFFPKGKRLQRNPSLFQATEGGERSAHCHFSDFVVRRMTLATSASLIRRLCRDILKPDTMWQRTSQPLMLISVLMASSKKGEFRTWSLFKDISLLFTDKPSPGEDKAVILKRKKNHSQPRCHH